MKNTFVQNDEKHAVYREKIVLSYLRMSDDTPGIVCMKLLNDTPGIVDKHKDARMRIKRCKKAL